MINYVIICANDRWCNNRDTLSVVLTEPKFLNLGP